MLLRCWTCDFRGLKVSQGKARTINRWGGISNHLSMAYLLNNICTKNYRNRTTIVEIIAGGWVVSFFEIQCIWPVGNLSHFEVQCMTILWTGYKFLYTLWYAPAKQWKVKQRGSRPEGQGPNVTYVSNTAHHICKSAADTTLCHKKRHWCSTV